MIKKKRIILISIVLILLIWLYFLFCLNDCKIERGKGWFNLVCYPISDSSDSDCEKKFESCLRQQAAWAYIDCLPCNYD